jgi:GR25 family glycosyltransferase involved in LPS biosynthesis
MEEQFKEAGIGNFKRVPAFDGKKLFGDPKLLASTVELPSEMKQSSGEIGCSLSHLRAAEMALELDDDYVMVMEDDIHLTFYGSWRTTVKEIVSQAPADWQVLQLTINNVRVLRTLLGLGSSFVPWRKNHWSTGAYLINRKGCQRAVDEFTRGPNSQPRYRLPANVQLVSDVLMYNGPGAYTHTRPLFDHEIKESTIHQGHVESCHRQASELGVALPAHSLATP